MLNFYIICIDSMNYKTCYKSNCICIFLRLHSQENQTPQEVKQEVLDHLREMQHLEESIPSTIVIGPFLLIVEEVRQSLVKKRRSLANAVLNRLALRLRQQMQDVSQLSVST